MKTKWDFIAGHMEGFGEFACEVDSSVWNTAERLVPIRRMTVLQIVRGPGNEPKPMLAQWFPVTFGMIGEKAKLDRERIIILGEPSKALRENFISTWTGIETASRLPQGNGGPRIARP